jgi:hypothetical protein
MKKCTSCKILKDLTDFCKNKTAKDNLQSSCKICSREKNRNSYSKNKEKKSNYRKKQYKNNKLKELNKNKEWKERNKQKSKENAKNYYQKNKKEINFKRKIRSQNNSKIRVSSSMRHAVGAVLKGAKASRSWRDLVGYSTDELVFHLESKFTKGMTWENYGKGGWELDHIIPQYYFKFNSFDHPAFKACWDLSNLQPLWATKEIAMDYGESSDYLGNREKNNRIVLTEEMVNLLDKVNL